MCVCVGWCVRAEWWCVVVCVIVCVCSVIGGVCDAAHVLVRMTLGRSQFPRGMSLATTRSPQCSQGQ